MSVAHGEPNPGSAEPIHVGKYQTARCFSEVGGQAAAYLAFDPDPSATSCSSATTAAPRPVGRGRGGPGPGEGRQPVRLALPRHRADRRGVPGRRVRAGRNLAEVRRDGPLDLAQVVRILVQLAEGVAAVHARGLIHRDIKPANVILHDDGTPRLVDFG